MHRLVQEARILPHCLYVLLVELRTRLLHGRLVLLIADVALTRLLGLRVSLHIIWLWSKVRLLQWLRHVARHANVMLGVLPGIESAFVGSV